MTKALLPSGSQTYSNAAPVTFQVWQTDLAFDHLNGQPRNTAARNSKDAMYWYDNYVNAWNAGDAAMRYSIDQQHGFFGGELSAIPEPPAPQATAPHVAPAEPAPPPEASTSPPTPQELSPEPDASSGSSIESVDHTPVSATVIQDEVEEDSKPLVEADTALGLTDDDETTDVTVRSQDEETNTDDDSLLTVRDVTPEDEVIDPATGTRYASPDDARRAGISNWVYATDWAG